VSSALKNSAADVVRQALVDSGETQEVGESPWPTYAVNVPPTPDNVVVVANGTDVVDRTMRGTLVLHSGFQLRVRSQAFNDGLLFANELQRWLAETQAPFTVTSGPTLGANSYSVLCFVRIGPVLKLGMNVPNDKRFNFTINALAVIRGLN
jgi:hypothetical protein